MTTSKTDAKGTLSLSSRQLRDLITPVLPMAANDFMLPVLNAVLIETDGKWLSAKTTDRFRIGVKRIEKRPTDGDESAEWPTFRALIPLRAARSLLTMFKPTRRSDPTLTLAVEDDHLIAEGSGSFDLFDASRFVYTLEVGEYPALDGLIRAALATADEERVSEVGVNMAFLADFKAAGSSTMRIRLGRAGRGPIVLTDDDGFLGLLMPRERVGGDEAEDWTDFFAEKSEPAKKRATRKAVA